MANKSNVEDLQFLRFSDAGSECNADSFDTESEGNDMYSGAVRMLTSKVKTMSSAGWKKIRGIRTLTFR